MSKRRRQRVESILRQALLLLAVLAAVVPCSGALAADDLLPPELEAKFQASFSPTALSAREQTPLSLRVGMGFKPAEGSILPALEEYELDADRHARLNLEGIPVCSPRPGLDVLPPRTRCDAALVGQGRIKLLIRFPEQMPIWIDTPLRAFNGPVREGKRTLLLVFYVTVPTPAVLVSRAAIEKDRDGPYGPKLVGQMPKIAGGHGAVTELGLRFRKGVFSAVCRSGHLATGLDAVFVDGTRSAGAVTRPCTAK